VVGEGIDKDQAAAKCYGIWRDQNKGKAFLDYRMIASPIRAVEGEDNVYKCYMVKFGDSDHVDLYGTYFTRATEYCLDWYETRPWLHSHGLNKFVKTRKVGDWRAWDMDDQGLFFLGELDLRHEYIEELKTLMKLGLLFPSSGAAGYLVKLDWKDGRMMRWPIVEGSSTVAPANYRGDSIEEVAVRAIQVLEGGHFMSDPSMTPTTPTTPTTSVATVTTTKGVVVPVTPAVTAATPNVQTLTATVEESKDASPLELPEGFSVESIRAALGVDQMIQAIQQLDEVIKQQATELEQMRQVIKGLAAPLVQQVKSAMAQDDWFKSLYVASRDAHPIQAGTDDAKTAAAAIRDAQPPLVDGQSPYLAIQQAQHGG
jgi:hypothetical protein